MSKVYTFDDWETCYDDVHEMVFDYLGDGVIDVNQLITIASADKYLPRAGDHVTLSVVNDLIESLSSSAFEDAGEASEEWPGRSTSHEVSSLKYEITKAVNIWADKKQMHPTFFSLKNMSHKKSLQKP